MKNVADLPRGWIETTLGELCEKSQYGWTTSASEQEGVVKFLRTTDITSGSINWNTVPYCEEEPPDREKFLLHEGDILISRSGSVGFSIVIPEDPPPTVFASYLIRFIPLDPRLSAYLGYFLQSPSYWRQISEKAVGIALKNVNAKKLSAVVVPLPPIEEQHRIVKRLDSLLSRLDAATNALSNVYGRGGELARSGALRMAILAKAFDGQLIPQLPADEPAEVLLEKMQSLNSA